MNDGGMTPGGMQDLRLQAGALPWPFWAAVAVVFVGWFPCDSLVTTVGALRLHFHFFDLASLIARPARIITGVNRGDALTLPFGILCLAALAATLAPLAFRHRAAQFGPCAPLALMVVTGTILYAASWHVRFTATGDAGPMAAALADFGNYIANRASVLVARRVSLGLGVWLSAAGALYLAHGALRGKWASAPGIAEFG